MEFNFNTRKGQGLPLNTIVLAILVIVVLLFIIVFFASNVGETGEDIDEARACGPSNPAIAANPQYSDDDNFKSIEEGDICGSGYSPVTGVSRCCVKTGESPQSNNDEEE